ncbi:hypothetical protein B0T16DRAFT_405697 [Cercophora newfieldiana]|uniref:Uncharacterized protein n=1 Tax=Cercophora newfieldiana TaxID=92897 RepID=A0AA39YGQ1_9PEZI|nr:hypothetical protein B0T16DRAFT_405697 [Cercophora newfieldiana]
MASRPFIQMKGTLASSAVASEAVRHSVILQTALRRGQSARLDCHSGVPPRALGMLNPAPSSLLETFELEV